MGQWVCVCQQVLESLLRSGFQNLLVPSWRLGGILGPGMVNKSSAGRGEGGENKQIVATLLVGLDVEQQRHGQQLVGLAGGWSTREIFNKTSGELGVEHQRNGEQIAWWAGCGTTEKLLASRLRS